MFTFIVTTYGDELAKLLSLVQATKNLSRLGPYLEVRMLSAGEVEVVTATSYPQSGDFTMFDRR